MYNSSAVSEDEYAIYEIEQWARANWAFLKEHPVSMVLVGDVFLVLKDTLDGDMIQFMDVMGEKYGWEIRTRNGCTIPLLPAYYTVQ